MDNKKEKKRFILICLLPAIVLFVVFMIIPTFNVFWMSTLKWGGLSNNKVFVGVNNFISLAQDMNFIRAMQNTILIIAVVTVVTMAIAILFASILVREKIKGQNFFRIIFYIPNILSVVVISSIFGAIYDPSHNGLLNSIISIFKPETWESIKFLGDPNIVIYAVIAAVVWQAIGYYMVMYMASMSSIPEHLYESASLDGASKSKQFFSITLPLVWENIRTTLVFFVLSTINISFLLVNALTSGGPDGASETVLGYIYKQAYNNSSYGYGMAIATVVFIFSFILSFIINRVSERDSLEL
ncbi:MAG: sugar ABC transporter permease [Erysipelotrichaceae bacterium]